MTNILIAGYYGLGNIGDEAILAGMINSLKTYIPDANISVLTNDPNITLNLHKVTPVEQSFIKNLHLVGQSFTKGLPVFFKNGFKNREFINIYKAIKKCDIFILGGGSLLQDLKFYYLPVLYSLLFLARLNHKVTVVYGIGAGPIDTKFGKYLSNKILNNTDLITVRDPMSKKVLDSCGVKNVIQTVDPAFGIKIPSKQEMELFAEKEYTLNENIISTTVYNWLQDSDIYCNSSKPNSEIQIRRHSIANVYNLLINKYQKKLMFIPTVKTDIDGYSKLNELISTRNQSSVKGYENDFNYVFSLLSSSEILIGMRLHSLILATIIGVPFVPISYCGKVKSYLEMIGMSEFYLDVEDIGKPEFETTLLRNFDTIYNNKQHYSNLLIHESMKYREIALENAKLVARLIEKGN